jgi:hypothetical protein
MMMGQARTANSKNKLGQEGASAMAAYIRSCIHIHAGPNRQQSKLSAPPKELPSMLKMFLAVKVAAAAVTVVGGGLVFVGAAGLVAGSVPLNLQFDGR